MAGPGTTTLVCRIELKKEKGITVKVEDQQGQLLQTIELDGKTIKLTCKSQQDTSTITQKPDGIEMKCKTFSVAAETVTIAATKAAVLKSSEDTLTLQSAKQLTLKTDDKLSATAAMAFEVKGQKLTAKADNAVELSGMTVEVKGTQSAKLSGATVEVTGQTQIEIKGAPSVKVASTGMLNLEGQMTTLKGQITNVQGSLVKLG
jgi:hypothetical protein